jgi:D-arabinose 1-dehydrogenase-like Zn-dependent alcohol dehydrogenase
MASMRAVQVSEPGGPFELVEREVPTPGPGEALVRVQACGICHSDSYVKEGGFPGVTYPAVPGHEIAGTVAALGEGARGWEVDQRVGVGWFGGNCGYCRTCRHGEPMFCENMGISGVTLDGGYADYVVVRSNAMALIPDELAAEEAAPLLCAGLTTYNALRHSGARGGTSSRSSASVGSDTSASSCREGSASAPSRSPGEPRRRSSPFASARTTT